MSQAPVLRQSQRWQYFGWFAGSGTAAVALAFALVLWMLPHQEGSASATEALRIDPPKLDIADRSFYEGDMVRGRFRLVNGSAHPVTVKSIETSCSCLASVAEGGRKPPFELEPSAAIDLSLTTSAVSNRGLKQTYDLVITAESAGKPLTPQAASLSFQVVDSLKAQPQTLRIAEASPYKPAHASVVLFTHRDDRPIADPEIAVSGCTQIRVSLKQVSQTYDDQRKLRPRFVLDVEVTPGEGAEPISGIIDVSAAGEPPTRIPVYCTFQQTIRFDPHSVEAAGRAGAVVEREVYLEASSDDWKSPHAVSVPVGCKVRIEPFDAVTNKMHVTVALPTQDRKPSTGDFIVLGPRAGKQTIRIPVHYTIED